MDQSVQQIATDWIAYARYSKHEDAPEQICADASSMYDLPNEQPELAWNVIRYIIDRYSEDELFSSDETEAQRVVGRVAATPLEGILGYHGADFIDRIEAEAQRDRRVAWALGGVWQDVMPDDLYHRVQKAAGVIPYWNRRRPFDNLF